MSHWIYKSQPFILTEKELEDEGLYGFVYLITFPDEKKYVGRKYFWSRTTRPPLKGRIRKRRIKKESNWRIYTSSSDSVREKISEHGKDNVLFEIVSLHPNKQETNYHEMKLQFILGVLEERDQDGDFIYLNENINTKFYKSLIHNDTRLKMSDKYRLLI